MRLLLCAVFVVMTAYDQDGNESANSNEVIIDNSSGSELLEWEAPTQNVDGSPLTDIAGFRVYQSFDQGGPYQQTDEFPDPLQTSALVALLEDPPPRQTGPVRNLTAVYTFIPDAIPPPDPPPNMALPTFVSDGALASGTGSVTANAPAGIQANDILLMQIGSEGDSEELPPGPNASDWELIGWTQSSSDSNARAARMAIYWHRYDGTNAPDYLVADQGDHAAVVVSAWRGVNTTHRPYSLRKFGGVIRGDAVQTQTIPGATTSHADGLVLNFWQMGDNDPTGGWTPVNADLTNVTQRYYAEWSSGSDGAMNCISGEKSTAGAFGATTFDVEAGTEEEHVFATIVLDPDGGNLPGAGQRIAPLMDGYTADGFNSAGHTFSHTPLVNDPSGVLLFLTIDGTGADGIAGATYGGVAMTEIAGSPYDGPTVLQRQRAWFLGSGVPTGPQDVVISGTTVTHAWAAVHTLQGDSDLEIAATETTEVTASGDATDTIDVGTHDAALFLLSTSSSTTPNQIARLGVAEWDQLTEFDLGNITGNYLRSLHVTGATTYGVEHSVSLTSMMQPVAVRGIEIAAGGGDLVNVDSMTQLQAHESAPLLQINLIDPENVVQLQTAETVTVSTEATVAPQDIAQAQVLDAANIVQTNLIDAENMVQLQVLDAVAIGQENQIEPLDLEQQQALEIVTLAPEDSVTVDGIAQLQLLDVVQVLPESVVSPLPIVQEQSLETVMILVEGTLVTLDMFQLQELGAVVLAQENQLEPESMVQLQVFSDAAISIPSDYIAPGRAVVIAPRDRALLVAERLRAIKARRT